MKLPKQWYHWCYKAGLKYDGDARRNKWKYCYLRGRNRMWRINCHGQLDMSCTIDKFDRWANSHEFSIDELPTNEKQFLQVIEFMLQQEIEE